jgi:hypothetical protein
MPAERRSFTAVRPVKTERTHEENQERAYIAASRRSDRSLEARIESARRASEIHKKRTGRALRVTEQDVINEEMYEEEDDDLPTQYQRLNAHINSSNIMFNKKLHDYIATQHGVRSMFMSQYQNPPFQQPLGFGGNAGLSSMPPPQFGPTMVPGFQQPTPYSPTSGPSQSFRQAPYQIPQRPSPHQRSMSIQLPNSATTFDPTALQMNGDVTTPQGGGDRRLSLPPQAFGQNPNAGQEGASQAMFSPSSSVHSPLTPSSGVPLSRDPSRLQSEADTPAFAYSPTSFPMSSQVFSGNPLTLSLPPESQQLIGSALDPNDPHTAILMSGSNNLAQPFSNYTYNPNATKQSTSSNATGTSSPTGPAQTLSAGINMKLETAPASSATSTSDGFFSSEAFFTPGHGDLNSFFDFSGGDFGQGNDEQGNTEALDSSNFVNWD